MKLTIINLLSLLLVSNLFSAADINYSQSQNSYSLWFDFDQAIYRTDFFVGADFSFHTDEYRGVFHPYFQSADSDWYISSEILDDVVKQAIFFTPGDPLAFDSITHSAYLNAFGTSINNKAVAFKNIATSEEASILIRHSSPGRVPEISMMAYHPNGGGYAIPEPSRSALIQGFLCCFGVVLYRPIISRI